MKNHVNAIGNNKSNNDLGGKINKEIGDIISEDSKISSIKTNLEDVKNVAYSLLNQLDTTLYYHKKEHTTDFVVPTALTIAELENFSWEDKLLVCISAAFHDTGFTKQYNENESIGAEFAEAYMRSSPYNYSEEQIGIVKDAIENTNMKNPPKTKFAKVLRDADLSIIGHTDFMEWNTALKEECKVHTESAMHEMSLNTTKWVEGQLGFISTFHKWFTNSAELLYEKGKKENIIAFKTKYKLK